MCFMLLFNQRERLKKNYGMYGGNTNTTASAPVTQPTVGLLAIILPIYLCSFSQLNILIMYNTFLFIIPITVKSGKEGLYSIEFFTVTHLPICLLVVNFYAP